VVVLLFVVGVVLLLGATIETVPHGVAAAGFFHSAVESVPGVGSFYAGFREMSTTIADGEESFRDVMGGFVIYVSRDRVHDIDISVEEGLQAIITSGVAMGESERTAVADRIQPMDDR
jgi:uncharacterized membrane protein